jgi:aldose 1-epimerase
MENICSLSGLRKCDFQQTVDGKVVDLFFLRNKQGAEVAVTNLGAKIAAIIVPDKNGNPTDVVLGKSSAGEYLNEQEPYFGAICGRTANRIDKGCFRLEGREYHLRVNNGPNCLHGGIKGFNAVVWDVQQIDAQTLKLGYLSSDGEEGYPGNLSVIVTYVFTDNNELKIRYKAYCDQTTIINLTNHSYFNLSGEGNPTIGDHLLEIDADYYLPTNDEAIPLGLPEMVEDTPFDFRKPYPVGTRIDTEHTQLIFGNGYDHNYIINRNGDGLQFCARAVSPVTGICMEVFTTEPGVQLYTGNYLDGSFIGKNGHRYPKRSAFCLETQHFPDSIHHPNYPTTVLKAGDVFTSETVYSFGLTEK